MSTIATTDSQLNLFNMASKHPDVDVLENWEDIDETDVLEQKFRRLLPPNTTIVKNSNSCNGDVDRTPINITLTGDDALRSQYVPPEPTVKILKRPTKEAPIINDNKGIQPKKTLQQREQAYAQARLRILGEAHSPDKKEDDKICSIQIKDLDNIIRHPRGPDGTRGFNLRR